MAFSILGLASALPDHGMSREESLRMANDCVIEDERQARIFRTIVHRTQIQQRQLCVPYQIAYEWVPVSPRQRTTTCEAISQGPTTAERMALYSEHASPLAIRSAQRALSKSDIAPQEITHLITVSCTGFEAPGVDIDLMESLGLNRTTERIHIGFMGCHGAINGMRSALGLAALSPEHRFLLCATELCSLHFCFSWDEQRIVGNALFADGSAAMVGGPPATNTTPWQVTASGSCLVPDSREAITWRVGDHGFEMSLSSRVPELIESHLKPWLQSWLAKQGLRLQDVGSWAIHPGGPKILDSVESALNLSPEQTVLARNVLRDHGNMSSPTVLFILEEMMRTQAALPCVALGFGPGLVAECALIR